MTTRVCRTCARRFEASGKTRYCSAECRCGTDAGYSAGCKCPRCMRAHARNHKRLRIFPNPPIPAIGTHRRIQALVTLGWSTAELSRRLGKHRSYLTKVLSVDRVDAATATAVEALYEQLSMTRNSSRTANRTAMDAESRGWLPPLAWDDIDDPDEQPTGWEFDGIDRASVLGDVLDRGGNTYDACRVLEVTRDALDKWCANNGHKHTFRALAAREVTRVNQYSDLDREAS